MTDKATPVSARFERITFPTYLPRPPDRNPMFLDKRVYQGSSGRVYPLPFYDGIADHAVPHDWDVVHLENEYLYVMILPGLGGRIHTLRDKTNGYDLIYHQPVIKPALVGLAGPWASGGIEFNWPQHHRPATFMPVQVELEHGGDGAITVWLGDHDPMARLRGVHGVCLRPGCARLELRVRAYNRTADTHTFLWWANAATRVHEHYQSFFPPDTTHVADHAKRATSTFPLCTGRYYGIDYAARAAHGVPEPELPPRYRPSRGYPPHDLSWYANIPVPTSYMGMGSREDFFGGYDHAARAGIVHVANHHIAPGKKQWTWGNHEFGYAWDRNLTEADAQGEHAPYIELMAGVYTDNQPDFSYLQPGETKVWEQYWYPIREIGPAQHANLEAAVHLSLAHRTARLGVAVTRSHRAAVVTLRHRGAVLRRWTQRLAPDAPLVQELPVPRGARLEQLRVDVRGGGENLLTYQPRATSPVAPPPPATEPAPPAEVSSNDELYWIGLHLEQYRHATRRPELYWQEALRRDPGDARCHLALGRWHLRRGEFDQAEQQLQASVARQTLLNPNPPDGEAHYQLGRCLRFLGRDDDAYAACYKATWSHGWAAAAYVALAEIDCTRGDWATAHEHLRHALRRNTDHLRARALLVIVLRRLGRDGEGRRLLRETLALDPLEPWCRQLAGRGFRGDAQTRLDVAHDCARAGLYREAIDLLRAAEPEPFSGTRPLIDYTMGWLHERSGDTAAARRARRAASAAPRDYCFPARLEEVLVLQSALAADPGDAAASYYLGNLFYDRRRYDEAILAWQRSARVAPNHSTVWRNLGIALFNHRKAPRRARLAYARAVRAAPADARLLYEQDQLWKRLRIAPGQRLKALEARRPLVDSRDDLTLEYCALLNQVGRPTDAQTVLASRRFQPWEGGEGQALAQHTRTHLALARAALRAGNPMAAETALQAALNPPANLGEARHLLLNQSDLHVALGDTYALLGQKGRAREEWRKAAASEGDFRGMQVLAYSEMTYFSALACQRLGQHSRATRLLRALLDHARALRHRTAEIDYFATSLPTLLLFDEDLTQRQGTTALVLEAQARLGLGETKAARQLFRRALARDPNHALAQDLLQGITPPRRR